MNKNLIWKFALILGLVIVAAWTLYPPDKTLKPGIDLAGGTSLIYEINTQGLNESDKSGLSERMITILRRRIDPTNTQNFVWRPQGSARFEIQMPMASAEARLKRQNYDNALNLVLDENISSVQIKRSLKKPQEERAKDLGKFSHGSADKLKILNDLVTVYDERNNLQNKRDELSSKLKKTEDAISAANANLAQVKAKTEQWAGLDEQKMTDSVKEFLGSNKDKLDLLTGYVKTYVEWGKTVEQLTDPDSGKNIQYKKAVKALDKLNLTSEQIDVVLSLPQKSVKREQAVNDLKTSFPDRTEKIDSLVAAYDQYYPFRGRLDDPKDLQRMLKGAGILEFRILPSVGAELSSDEVGEYIGALKTKGPKYASDNKYVWCEVENINEWKSGNSITAPFGNKSYVLASNKPDEAMLHGIGKKEWKLEESRPTQDNMGRRAISFILDERGGRIFGKISGANIGRQLCILLDGIAISAPTINDRITTSGIITGSYSQTEQTDMVNKLNAGSLPARLVEQPISVKTIGPSIGADNRDKGIKSGIIGLVAVVIFMVVYYHFAGMVADVALILNTIFLLAIMAMFRATFTLAGIAGFVLTIGMSVDTNVLIYERLREEQQRGASVGVAIKNAYHRVFSVILDSHVTTISAAAILYWVASEEIKSFAIVLIIGLLANLFTALFVTRAMFDLFLQKRILKNHLSMLHIIRGANINWMGLRPAFLTFSTLLAIGGIVVFFTRDDTKNSKYDIEFTGGTSIQINLKDNVNLSRQDVENRIHQSGEDLKNPALAAASVYSVGESGKQYEINTTETNKTVAVLTFPQNSGKTIETITSTIVGKLSKPVVKQAGADSFSITTSLLNKFLVNDVLKAAFPDATISEMVTDEVVNNAVMKAFANELTIQQNLRPKIISTEKITEQLVDSYPELADFLGGVKIACEIERPATADEIDQRLKDLRFKSDMRNLNWYSYKILGSSLNVIEPNQQVKSFAYVSVDPEAGFRELEEDERTQLVDNEKNKILSATSLETSLPRVTQIDPSIGAEAKTRALIAIILSLLTMVVYLGSRFGNVRYGIGAIVSLMHDVCITLGVVCTCTFIAMTIIGQKLLIGDFKIDMVMIGAFLTLVGYSVNDTIVVFDRIRENSHKGWLTPKLINDSINQTLSRTILTSFTTFLVVLVMYIFGGPSISLRGFNFAMLFGIFIGTYSSIAIAAPILLFGAGKKEEASKK